MDSTSIGQILNSLGSGLPILLLHFGTTLVLLALGVVLYTAITPFRERALITQGSVAAGVVLAGAVVALAIPLAATLASSHVWWDVVIWGLVAVVLQLVTLGVVALLFRGLKDMIERDNVGAALALAGVQIGVALLNAGAMAG